jgi:predicted lipoprotein with Yx(FWY)xxD motif
MNGSRILILLPLAAGLAINTGCGNSGGSKDSGAPASAGATLSPQSTSLGTILANDKGRTVYVFANDKGSTSTCNGACAADWPPVLAPSTLPGSLPGVTGALGTTKRSDGRQQLTVAGHPVYTFSGDSSAGETNGQGITLNGGLWTAVLPSGQPDTSPTNASSTAPNSGY